MNFDIIFNKWGLGIGDWGLGIGDWAQSPNPHPPSPIPNPQYYIKIHQKKKNLYYLIKNKLKNII